LNIIELQACKPVTTERDVLKYFTGMEQCNLIVGSLTLKSPVGGFQESAADPYSREKFSAIAESIPVLKRSKRQLELRQNAETEAIKLVMNDIQHLLETPGKLEKEEKRVETLLLKQMETEQTKKTLNTMLKRKLKRKRKAILRKAAEAAEAAEAAKAAAEEAEATATEATATEAATEAATARPSGLFNNLTSIFNSLQNALSRNTNS
jgi:hypothetical protein